ncbi:MAG: AMP-binding protein, partial [Pseudomonadales bacterium]
MPDKYNAIYQRSIEAPAAFWGEAAQAVHWDRPPSVVLDNSNAPFIRWFADGEINACYNALDLHVEQGRADQAALVYDSPVTNTVRTYTYRQLRDEVACLAGVLQARGVVKGDRVIIYMPMIPESVMAMLACSRLGAIHSVVFGGFAANELAVRIDDAEPKLIMSASCGIEAGRVIEYKPLLDAAIQLAAHKPEASLVLQREQAPAALNAGRDFDWAQEMTAAQAAA